MVGAQETTDLRKELKESSNLLSEKVKELQASPWLVVAETWW